MNKNWEMKTLGEVCELINRGISPKYIESDGLYVLNQKCIRNHIINYDLARFHDNEIKQVSSEKIIQIGDVLVNSTGTGTLGRVAQVRENPNKATVDSHVTIVRPLKELFYNDFFGYALVFIEGEIAKRGEGCGGQTELSRDVLKNDFKIAYPKSISEQQQIVAILDETFTAIDKAKENAEKNLQNARELFESTLQSIFTEKGEGWGEKTVEELVNEGVLFKPLDGNHGEVHPKKNDYVEDGVPFIMASDLKNGSVDFTECKFIPKNLANSLRTGFAQDGDILLSHKATIGRTAILRTADDYVMLTPQVTYYRVKDENRLFNKFIHFYFLSPRFQREISDYAGGGSTRAYIGITKQLKLNFLLPPLPEQQSIVAKLDALSAETKRLEEIYQQKLAALDELKKSVLQKAFSGELTGA